jgi:predicted methyltransferase MtxX (methanogen marker protein 4)
MQSLNQQTLRQKIIAPTIVQDGVNGNYLFRIIATVENGIRKQGNFCPLNRAGKGFIINDISSQQFNNRMNCSLESICGFG